MSSICASPVACTDCEKLQHRYSWLRNLLIEADASVRGLRLDERPKTEADVKAEGALFHLRTDKHAASRILGTAQYRDSLIRDALLNLERWVESLGESIEETGELMKIHALSHV